MTQQTLPDSGMAERIAARTPDILAQLVGFDTTSRDSNLHMIAWVEEFLNVRGIASERVPDKTGAKSSLLASIGPDVAGGVVLSGHTDVVPVDGQPWTTPPFELTLKDDGRYYGRGTCDMKGFLALSLATVEELTTAAISRPAHLAFSYDEEIGCLGAPDLIRHLLKTRPAPDLVIVGEPTSMQVVCGHKGIANHRITVTGKEAHSSQPEQGCSAIMAAIPLLAALDRLAQDLRAVKSPAGDLFQPPYPSLTVGVIEGGTAHNILARRCSFVFDLRCPPGIDPDQVLSSFQDLVRQTDATMKALHPDTGVELVRTSVVPPLGPEPGGLAEQFARTLSGDNGPARAVGFAAEAGQFQQAGLSTIICGPGSIDQAHQPDEYVDVSQLQRGADFMSRLVESLRGSSAG